MTNRRHPGWWSGLACVGILASLSLLSVAGNMEGNRKHSFAEVAAIEVLQGEKGVRHLEALLADKPELQSIHRKLVARLAPMGYREEYATVVKKLKKVTATPLRPEGLLGAVDRVFNVELHAQEWYTSEGTIVSSPFENDSNGDTAEFNLWWIGATGVQYAHDLYVHTPGNYTAFLGNSEGYDDYNGGEEENWEVFQTRSWRGVSCASRGEMIQMLNNDMNGHVYSSLGAMAASVVPCVGATVGWSACVGGSYFGYLAFLMAQTTSEYTGACH